MIFAIFMFFSWVAAEFDEIAATKSLIELYEAKIEIL